MVKENKRTLRNRISFGMRLAISITVIFYSILLIIAFGSFLNRTGNFISASMSRGIAEELSSPQFARKMKVDSIKDMDKNSAQFFEWSINTSHRLSTNAFLDISFISNNSEYLKELYNFVNVSVYINDELIYTNKTEGRIIIDKRLDSLRDREIKYLSSDEKRFIQINAPINTYSKSEIYDESNNAIGYVTASVNNTIVMLLLSAVLTIVAAAGLLVMLSVQFIVSFFSKPIIMPLNKLQEKMDSIATGDLESAMNTSIMFKKPLKEIDALASSTNLILSKVRDYAGMLENQNVELEAMANEQRETNLIIERGNNQLQNILDNIGQGFITFDENLLIHHKYSRQCFNIFGESISDKKLSSLIYAEESEEKEFMDSIFTKVFKDEVKIDLYINLLPEETQINGRNVGLEYRVVNNINSDKKKSVMVILTDITDKRALERKMEEEKNILKMVVKAVSHYSDFAECIRDYEAFLSEELPELLTSKMSSEEILTEIYRKVHNFKGNFSQFDTVTLVGRLHDVETSLESLKFKQNLTALDISSFITGFPLGSWLYEDLKILEEFLGKDFFRQEDTIVVDKKTLLNLEDKMLKLLSFKEFKLLLPEIRSLRYKSFKELLYVYTDYLEKLSERLGKNINPLIIEGEDILIDQDRYRDFTKSLVHVFRNALDHGIETMEERVSSGKGELGNVKCRVERDNYNIIVNISDDGRGLSYEALLKKTIELGLADEKAAAMLSRQELSRIIFYEGFSLKDEASDVSGRGYGLYSVMKELQKIGGRVELSSEEEKGTEFKFIIPIQSDDLPEMTIDSIIDSVVSTAVDFIRDTAGIVFEDNYEINNSDRVNLNTLSAFINIRGIVQGIMILSFNEELARRLAEGFIIDDLSAEEINEYMEDVTAECSNIILGNSVKLFGEIENYVSIGTPTIVCHKGASIKYTATAVTNCRLISGSYEAAFSFVSIDNFIPGEE